MTVCPVCEHAQAQGTECEVCGKVLAPAPAAPPATPPVALDGLERTALGEADVGGVVPMADLESTLHAPAPPVADLVPDLEATRAAPVDVAVAPEPDVERTAHGGLPADDGFALPPLPVCRYCRTPATADERICARCGMRLPAVTAAAEPRAAGEERRCSCGLLLAPEASRCPSCGARAG